MHDSLTSPVLHVALVAILILAVAAILLVRWTQKRRDNHRRRSGPRDNSERTDV
jgi:hypothetical protein